MAATPDDNDYTLTSPLAGGADLGAPVLALTIIWHPDQGRIGAQYLSSGARGTVEVGRYTPLFRHPDEEGVALGFGGVSRLPLRIESDGEGRLQVIPPESRMVVELNGQEIAGPARLEPAQLVAGVMIGLGRAVLLCVHWMHCLPSVHRVDGLIGVSGAAVRTREQIRAAAATSLPVLLLGETGTGKEVAARAIHALSKRSGAQLVTVNMAALGESLAAAELFGSAKGAYTGAQSARAGLFGEADGGTLFLDEIGDTPALVQPMLLRVLESGVYRPIGAAADRHSSARLITATDQDLYGAQFNQALLRRLEGFVIVLPPLRQRREDIGVLLWHLSSVDRALNGPAPEIGFALVSALANHDWPGNVRQLGHVVGRVLLALRLGETPSLEMLGAGAAGVSASANASGAQPPAAMADAASPAARPATAVTDALDALEANGWLIQGAARALGVSRPTMYKLIESHPAIRRPELIGEPELRAALAAGGNDIRRCAAVLKTPAEALRRHLRALGMVE
ncbi:sigma 54-interacting transcriptional regulator [Duganella sp. PWIR1]